MTVLNRFADDSGGKAWLLSGDWTLNRGAEIPGAAASKAAVDRSNLPRDRFTPRVRRTFTLALEVQDESVPGGRLDHIGLQVDAEDLDRLCHHAPALRCQIAPPRSLVPTT